MVEDRCFLFRALIFVLLISSAAVYAAGGVEDRSDRSESVSVGVFVPGVVDGSPSYELLVAGTRAAVDDAPIARLAVIEAGFDQSTWPDGLMAMAASGSYDIIVSSNPSMPEIAAEVIAQVPEVRFVILDGALAGVQRLHTIVFDQDQQAYLSGYFAGLLTASDLPNSNAEARVGLLAGQEYPVMNDIILPAFTRGARDANAAVQVDFRVLGNWFDAARAQDLATDMIERGSDTILTIAGGGNQGVVSAARERGAYVLWYDDSGYEVAPGVVLGSTFVRLDAAARDAVSAAIAGELEYGVARQLGVADGMVGFDTEHPAFRDNVPIALQNEMERVLASLATE